MRLEDFTRAGTNTFKVTKTGAKYVVFLVRNKNDNPFFK